jgi:hypothetical protein
VPEIVLHFEAGTDAEAVARQLQERANALPGVTSAQAEGYPKRGMPEVILVLTVLGTVLNNGASTLDALKRFIESAKGVGHALGLGQVKVEVGTKQVEPAALTDAHAIDIERGG